MRAATSPRMLVAWPPDRAARPAGRGPDLLLVAPAALAAGDGRRAMVSIATGRSRQRAEALVALALVAVVGLLLTGQTLTDSDEASEAEADGANAIASAVEPARDAVGAGSERGAPRGTISAADRAAAPTPTPRLTSARTRRDPKALRDYERCYGPTMLLLRPPAPLCLHPPTTPPRPPIVRHPPRQT
jgi:hypothetical protein